MTTTTNQPIKVNLSDVSFELNGANLDRVLTISGSFSGPDPRINRLRELMVDNEKAWVRLYREDQDEFATCRCILETYTESQAMNKAAEQALKDLATIVERIKGKKPAKGSALKGGRAETTSKAHTVSSARGLPNLRNTCYVNAVLQGAFVSPQILAELDVSLALVEEPYFVIHQSLSCIIEMLLDPRLEEALLHPVEPAPLNVRSLQEKLIRMEERITQRIEFETKGLEELKDCLPFAEAQANARLRELDAQAKARLEDSKALREIATALGKTTRQVKAEITAEIKAEKGRIISEYNAQVRNIKRIQTSLKNYNTMIDMLKDNASLKANLLRIFLYECDTNFPGINWGPQGDSEEILIMLLENLQLESYRTTFQYKGYTRETIAQGSNTRYVCFLPGKGQHLIRATRPFNELQMNYNSTLLDAIVKHKIDRENQQRRASKAAKLTEAEIDRIREQAREEFVPRPLDLQNLLKETFTRADRCNRVIPLDSAGVIHPQTLEQVHSRQVLSAETELFHEQWRSAMIVSERLPHSFMLHLPRLIRDEETLRFNKNHFALTGLIDVHPETHQLESPKPLALNVFAPLKPIQEMTHSRDLRARELDPVAVTPRSFICHSGSAKGGHYYTIAYNTHLKKWEYISDSLVRDATEKDVIGVLQKDGSYRGGLHSNVVIINFENTTLKRQLAARARVEVVGVQDSHLTDAESARLQSVIERQRARVHHRDSDTEHKEEAKK